MNVTESSKTDLDIIEAMHAWTVEMFRRSDLEVRKEFHREVQRRWPGFENKLKITTYSPKFTLEMSKHG